MRKEFVIISALSLAVTASAQVAIDNGPFQTHATGGPGNAPRSTLQFSPPLNLNTYGFGCQKDNAVNNRVADDFVVPAGARLRLNGFRFYAYESTATSLSINDANVRVWGGGAPNGGGSVVAGDPTTNIFSSGSSTGVYRVDDAGGETFNGRLIMEVRTAFGLAPVLNPGTYWADWQLGGNSALTGPWQVPVTILGQTAKPGSNGLQFLNSSASWLAALDQEGGPVQDHAYKVIGSWIVNPNAINVTFGLLVGGTVASLAASDDNRVIIAMDSDSGSTSRLEMTAVSPSSTASALAVKTEMRSSRRDLSQFVELQNTSNAFESVDFSVSTLADTVRTVIITSNPGRFLRPGNVISSRIRTIPNADMIAQDGWIWAADHIEFEITPL